MGVNPIREKNELVRIIKALAKDLDARAEDIANDYNKRIRSINISADIELGLSPEWSITKNYPVLVITDDIADKIEDIVNNPNDAPKTMKAQASLQAPIKNEKTIVDEIGEAVRDSLNPINIKIPDTALPKVEMPYYIGADFGNGFSKSSMYRSGGDG